MEATTYRTVADIVEGDLLEVTTTTISDGRMFKVRRTVAVNGSQIARIRPAGSAYRVVLTDGTKVAGTRPSVYGAARLARRAAAR